MLTPTSIEELQSAVLSLPQVKVRGGGSKPALSRGANLSAAGLTGILDYQPSEYTFTALAGTPVSEVQAVLVENRQFLPFDPPLVDAGATLGGTVAAGLSGPGRFRFGGVRDFLLGVRIVTGEGRIVFGGGKVVKNAAGFDIPKLMVGSLGQLAVLAELTFKVFPVPEEFTTILARFESLDAALNCLRRLAVSQEELMCLDLDTPLTVQARIAGLSVAQPARTERICRLMEGVEVEVRHGDDDRRLWSEAREFLWVPPEHRLVRIPMTPSQIPVVEAFLLANAGEIPRRYSVGGNVAWLACSGDWTSEMLDRLASSLHTAAQRLTGEWDVPLPGLIAGQEFLKRLQSVFDPDNRMTA